MWIYKNTEIKELIDVPENSFGFIYEITHVPTGKKYLGKKQLISVRKKALGKKELTLLTDKRTKKYKIVKTEGDWKTYYGSNPEIKKMVKEGKKSEFLREILMFVPSKKLLTYYENKFLFERGVIEPDSNYINDNIEGRYFKKDFLNVSLMNFNEEY
ncbi:MAG TPA: hypothetical protein PKC87_01080 [Candidatus Absconditabacterales bacterium]|nr:hypothetical protein [Candidatus Absconditabacterales bacterium]